MSFRHLIDFGDLTRAEWEELYQRCAQIMDDPTAFTEACKGRIQANLFFEPSTRTKFSFQAAMLRLGGTVFGFDNPNNSSAAKGETLKDTIKMVSAYADVIVMRNPKEGAAKAASLYSEVPVINAGDGGHMHPTQTLADLTTIQRYRGAIDGVSIGLCGDLKNGRTVHSLIKALAKFDDVKFYLISPRELAIPDYMRSFMQERGLWFREVTGLEPVLPRLDVLYMTRIQRERFSNPAVYERLKDSYILDPEKMKLAKEQMCVLHPLPRVNEIAVAVDDDPRAAYFRQALNGKYMRMALILMLLKEAQENPAREPIRGELRYDLTCRNPRCISATEQELPQIFRLTDRAAGIHRCIYCEHIAD